MSAQIEVWLTRVSSNAATSNDAARLILLDLLGERIGRTVWENELRRTEAGKPYLPDQPWRFSFSYRLPWIALAVARDCEVGVDVEIVRKMPDLDAVAIEFFPEEAAVDYASTPHPGHIDRFYYWWTRIEAAVKATGSGLDASTDCFAGVVVESCPEAPAGVALAVAGVAEAVEGVSWNIFA